MVRYRPWPIPRTVPLGGLGFPGLAVALVGMATGAYVQFVLDINPLGWLLFVTSFILLVMASLYTMAWEWDHIPTPAVTPPEPDRVESESDIESPP